MSICACCNLTLETEYAYDHTLCPVCDRSGCTAIDKQHSESHRQAHIEERSETKKRKLTQKQQS